MSEPDDLDLTQYDAAVVEHALFGFARARQFDAIVSGKAWDVDLGEGGLTIGGRRHPSQILGTFSKASKTFMWAWGNPGAPGWGPSLGAANALRAIGEKPGNAVFKQRTIAQGWVDPRELAYVAGELSGGLPVYAPDTGQAIVFFLVGDTRLEPAELPLVKLPGVLLDFQSFAVVDLRAAVSRFLQRIGLEVRQTSMATWAERNRDGSSIEINWLPDGRFGPIKMNLSPSAAQPLELR